jgi:hypothetical protein
MHFHALNMYVKIRGDDAGPLGVRARDKGEKEGYENVTFAVSTPCENPRDRSWTPGSRIGVRAGE